MFMVISEDGYGEYWFYGLYDNRNKANEVASERNSYMNTKYSVIPAADAVYWEVNNVPDYAKM